MAEPPLTASDDKIGSLPPPLSPPRIELLGLPRLVLASGAAHPLERHDAALLAWLVLQGPTPRQRIVQLLWPDVATRTAQNNLRQRLFRLKQRAGHPLVVSGPIMTLADGLEHDLGQGRSMPIDPNARSAPTLLGSLSYDDGDELSEWVATRRERWASEWRERLAMNATELELQGRIAEALVFAERLAADAPTAEHAHRRVMRLHYRRGDRAAALAAYQQCRDALRRELGALPGHETQDLAILIEHSGALPPPVAAPSPVATLRPPRLIGRQTEWHAIETAWQHGQPVLLRGEPGIGKTRLATDFATARDQPAVCRAHPGDAHVPYALLARLLRGLTQRFGPAPAPWIVAEFARLMPEFGPAPPGHLEPLRLRQAFADALAHWQRGGLAALVIDDLQFADAASLDSLLAWMTAKVDMHVIVTVRGNEAPEALRRWLDARGPESVCELDLAPLDPPAVEALLDSLGIPELDSRAWAAPLARHTGGNPLFILETLKAQLAARPHAPAAALPNFVVPAQIGKMLERRLAQLAPDALRLARLAALAGLDFSVALAAGVLGCQVLDLAQAWAELQSAQILGETGFAHDLILDATLRSVPRAIAITLHHAIAAALERDRQPPARVAHHWHAAGEWRRAAPQFELAAEAAQAASRPAEALAAWDAAAACHRGAGLPDSQASALECDWYAVRRMTGLGSLKLALARADAMLAVAADDRQRAVALESRAHVLAERNEPAAALADAERAGTLARAAADARLALLAAHQAARALMQLGRADDAIALRQTHAHRVDFLDEEPRLEWLSSLASALDYADRRSEALHVFDGAIEQATRAGRWDLANAIGCDKAIALLYLNRLPDSTAAARLAVEHGRLAGLEPGSLLMDDMNLAGNLRDLGEFSEFLRIAEGLPAALRAAGHAVWAHNAENDLAGGYFWLGRHDLALKALSPLSDDVPPTIRAARLFTQARLARGRTLPPGAETPAQLVRRAHALLESAGVTTRSYVRLKVALEVARDAEPEAAIAPIAAIEHEAREREQFMLSMHALVLRIEALLRAEGGTPARAPAADAARELVQRCEREGTAAGLYAPEVWWVAHRALAGVDPLAARACLARAIAWIDRVAAHQVPALFRDSFLLRNPINAAVRAAVARA